LSCKEESAGSCCVVYNEIRIKDNSCHAIRGPKYKAHYMNARHKYYSTSL